MTTPLESLLDAAGVAVELTIAEIGSRGCVIGRPAIGGRALVTVVGPDLPSAARRGSVGWDLPLRSIEDRATPNGSRTCIVEDLPVGVPSTIASVAGYGAGAAPEYVVALARLLAEAHGRGELVGYLHPDLVFVDPATGSLVAVAQRPIRAALAAPAWEGDAALFGLDYLTPGDVRRREPSAGDDIHRLAGLIWRWRHGVPPFRGLSEAEHLNRLASAGARPGGAAASVDQPTDDLDELLATALRPDLHERPSAEDLEAAVLAAGAGWRLTTASSAHLLQPAVAGVHELDRGA
ncbi:MAG: hypothetical protein ABI620_00145 [Chloroflexota bacterium]